MIGQGARMGPLSLAEFVASATKIVQIMISGNTRVENHTSQPVNIKWVYQVLLHSHTFSLQ